MEERITELEIKISFQEELLDTLNQTVVRQQQQLDLLQQQMRVLYQQMKNDSSPAENAATNEIDCTESVMVRTPATAIQPGASPQGRSSLWPLESDCE